MAIPRNAFSRRLPLRQMVCVVPIGAVGVWTAEHRSLIAAGAGELLAANRYWLLAAAGVTLLSWVAMSVARQGTVLERLPVGRLIATQFAAGAANNLLPAGIGASAVNLRFLRRRGLSMDRSSTALGLYLLMEGTARVVLLAVLLAVFPNALRLRSLTPDRAGLPVAPAVGGLLCAAVCTVAVGLTAIRPLRRAVQAFVTTALADIRKLHARPARVLALWGGSLGFPALQAAALVAVASSLGASMPVGFVVIAYLAASILAAAVPTPGGLGSVDAALVLALVTVGAPVGTATSVVLGFRIVTVWLPLVPGALVLSALVRWKVI